jgi:thiol-disulfide isomerase/thioredoxin
MISLTTDNFAENMFTKDTNKLAIVQFTAPWCSSCQDILPTINQLEEDYTNVLFFKVDVDKFPELADTHNVDKLPTFLFFKNRKVVNFIIGNESFIKFKKIIEKEMK